MEENRHRRTIYSESDVSTILDRTSAYLPYTELTGPDRTYHRSYSPQLSVNTSARAYPVRPNIKTRAVSIPHVLGSSGHHDSESDHHDGHSTNSFPSPSFLPTPNVPRLTPFLPISDSPVIKEFTLMTDRAFVSGGGQNEMNSAPIDMPTDIPAITRKSSSSNINAESVSRLSCICFEIWGRVHRQLMQIFLPHTVRHKHACDLHLLNVDWNNRSRIPLFCVAWCILLVLKATAAYDDSLSPLEIAAYSLSAIYVTLLVLLRTCKYFHPYTHMVISISLVLITLQECLLTLSITLHDNESCGPTPAYYVCNLVTTPLIFIIFFETTTTITVLMILMRIGFVTYTIYFPQHPCFLLTLQFILPMYAMTVFCAYLCEVNTWKRFYEWYRVNLRSCSAVDAARTANETKRRFLQYIFHEIRVPFNALFLALECAGEDLSSAVHFQSEQVMTPSSREKASLGDLTELVDIMRDQALSIRRILDDVLSLQKIEDGKFEIHLSEFSLPELVRSSMWSHRVLSEEKCIDLRLEKNVPNLTLIGDKQRLTQCLQNLISNGIKFTHQGGSVAVRVEEDTDERDNLSVNANVFWLKVSCRDTGVGISAADQARLFSPYVQINAGALQKGGGTGLGLNIVRHIVELHGGHISVSSVLGEGSCFIFSVPLSIGNGGAQELSSSRREFLNPALADTKSARSSLSRLNTIDGIDANFLHGSARAVGRSTNSTLNVPALTPSNSHEVNNSNHVAPSKESMDITGNSKSNSAILNEHPPPLHIRESGTAAIRVTSKLVPKADRNLSSPRSIKKRVLLVEDSIPSQKMVSRILSRIGCTVSVADNGSVALDLVRLHGSDYFHLILCDAIMPVMDGYTATKELRSVYNVKIPIIALTGNALQEDIDKFIRCGADDVLTKPVSVKQLEECVKKWVIPNIAKDMSRLLLDDQTESTPMSARCFATPTQRRNSVDNAEFNSLSASDQSMTESRDRRISLGLLNDRDTIRATFKRAPSIYRNPSKAPLIPSTIHSRSVTGSRRGSINSIHSDDSGRQGGFDPSDNSNGSIAGHEVLPGHINANPSISN